MRARRGHVHHFKALTFDGIPVLRRWKCRCGLKVRSYELAEQLEGTSL